jgi:hypothetical protein
VASNSQGITVTWGGVTLGEVVNVSVDGLTADTVEVTPRSHTGRNKIYSVADTDVGTVSVTLRGAASMSTTNVGLTATLSISGPGVSWSFTGAIFETLGWSASVGELQQYRATFKVGA